MKQQLKAHEKTHEGELSGICTRKYELTSSKPIYMFPSLPRRPTIIQ
jgi:hypothetical protein